MLLKHFLLPLLFIASTSLFSQATKGYSIQEIEDSPISIVSKGKKVGLYNSETNKFEVVPHKGHILHFEDVNFLFDIYPKEQKVLTYHYYQNSIQLLETPFENGDFVFGLILKDEWDTQFNRKVFNFKYAGDSLSKVGINLNYIKQLRIEDELKYLIKDNRFHITFRHTNFEYYNDVPLIAVNGDDSIMLLPNGDYEFVYPEIKEMYVYHSGIYNLKTGNWDIPAQYEKVKEWEGVYGGYYWPLAAKDAAIENGGVVFDFYKDSKNGIEPTEFMKRQKFALPLELWPFANEEVWYDPDSIYIYHQGTEGVGLFKVPLSGKNTDWGEYTLDWYNTEGHFDSEEIFQAKYEYIIRSGDIDYLNSPGYGGRRYILASKGDSKYDILFTDERRERYDLSTDTLLENIIIKKSIELTSAEFTSMGYPRWYEDVAYIDDSYIIRINPDTNFTGVEASYKIGEYDYEYSKHLYRSEFLANGNILVNSYSMEDGTQDLLALTSFDGYDSIDVEGNTVYIPPEPGNFFSGVFNPQSHQWLIDPNKIEISQTNGGYLIKKPCLNQIRNLDSVSYDFLNSDGMYVLTNISENEFTSDEKYKKYKIPGSKADEVELINSVEGVYYSFKRDGKQGIAKIFWDSGEVIVKPTELVVISALCDVSYSIEDDKLKVRSHFSNSNKDEVLDVSYPLVSGTKIKLIGNTYGYEEFIFKYDNFFVVSETKDSTSYMELKSSERLDKKQQLTFFDGFSNDTIPSDFESSYDNYESFISWKFDVAVLDNQLIHFENYQSDFQETYPLISFWGDDSIDTEGNSVYPEPLPGFYRSGIYDANKKEWLIKPEAKSIQPMSATDYVIERPILSQTGLNIGYTFELLEGDKTTELISNNFTDKKQSYNHYGVRVVNKDLIIVNDSKPEIASYPLQSYVFLGEDSISDAGEVVYATPEIGLYKCGIYNVSTDSWLIERNNLWVVDGEEEEIIMIVHANLDNKGFLKEKIISVIQYDGTIIIDKQSIYDLPEKFDAFLMENVPWYVWDNY